MFAERGCIIIPGGFVFTPLYASENIFYCNGYGDLWSFRICEVLDLWVTFEECVRETDGFTDTAFLLLTEDDLRLEQNQHLALSHCNVC